MTVEEQLAAALAEVESLRTAIAEKDCIIRDLQNRLLWLRKKVFGQTKHPEDREILSPERPPAPVARCMAGASVLSDIIVGKFVYHLPFYRQIQQYRECGITMRLHDGRMV